MKIATVDSFTGVPFAGNPAGVCILEDAAPVEWMQNVAREMNHAETAFLYAKDGAYHLRWFTPTKVEIALCGHATIASAHILWQEGHLKNDEQARFDTLSGRLTADREDSWVKLDFPAKIAEAVSSLPAGLLESIGVGNPKYVGKNQFDYLVEVESEAVLRSLAPNFTELLKVEARGVIVTTRSESPEYDFVSRFFAPAVGVDEDPATGSAHCALAPYWGTKLGKTDMVGFQASARTGVVRVAVRGDRVWLYGQAVTILTGQLVPGPAR